jgi:uncharacterized protein YjbJ (UPF0337 family)
MSHSQHPSTSQSTSFIRNVFCRAQVRVVYFSTCLSSPFRVSSKSTAQYHSIKGTVTETIGDLTGATSWQQSGREEHAQGEAEYNAARAKGYVDGTTDRLTGKMDSVVGAVTGDESRQVQGRYATNLDANLTSNVFAICRHCQAA